MTPSALLCAGVLSSIGHAADDDFDFELEGYYRIRSYAFTDLYEGQIAKGRYATQRLRLEPGLDFEDRAKFFMQSDVLNDAVLGDNEDLASTALFAGDPSSTGLDGQHADTFRVNRAWTEFSIPVGVLRVGRQPSNWGMGLLANDGNGFDDDFGENYGGSTYDRAIFATKPILVATTLANMFGSGKVEPRDVPLFTAVGIDRLVEDPLTQYYGYPCDPADYGTADADPRCTADEDHSYTNDERTTDQRTDAWWVDSEDDVYEMIYVIIYKGEGVHILGRTGDLSAGVYGVNRRQIETNSKVWIYDAYLRAMFSGLYLEGEALTIRGHTEAIALQGAYDPYGELENPLSKDANIVGYVGRAGYVQEAFSVIMETGYASGDNNVADEDFTGRPIHPEYNVGLLFYEEIMPRVTAAVWTDAANGLWSKGGVYNSRYIFPRAKLTPVPGLELIGGYLMAWPDQPDGANVLCKDGDVDRDGNPLDCALFQATADHMATEIDLAAKYRFHKHILFSLESGWATVTDRVPLSKAGLKTDEDGFGHFFTLQSRLAYEF